MKWETKMGNKMKFSRWKMDSKWLRGTDNVWHGEWARDAVDASRECAGQFVTVSLHPWHDNQTNVTVYHGDFDPMGNENNIVVNGGIVDTPITELRKNGWRANRWLDFMVGGAS